MRHLTLYSSLGLVLLASGLLLAACSESTIEEEAAVQYAASWAPSVQAHVKDRAVRAAGGVALQERMSAAAQTEKNKLTDDEPGFDGIIEAVYAAREFAPALVDDEGLTAAGQAIWEVLQDLDSHRLDPTPYELEVLTEAKERFEAQLEGVTDFEELRATAEDESDAVAWLIEQPISQFELVDANFGLLTESLLEEETRGARLRQALVDYQEARGDLTAIGAEIEHRLARGLVRYAHQQRHHRLKEIFLHPRVWDYYNEADVENAGRRPDPAKGAFRAREVWRHAFQMTEARAEENRSEILQEKIAQTLREVIDAEEPGVRVAAIAPQQPQYAGLVAEYKRYSEIVDAGGWEELSRHNLREGQSDSAVTALKKRLQIEGYFPGDREIDDTFDEALTEAIRAYQKTHQMSETGRPHNAFWASLNIPAERRLAQIGINIERWRDSNIDHSQEVYAFVNVPDFTVEVYEDQTRVARHATVVGTNEHSVNPLTNEEEYINRTPTPYAAYIDRVIYNPYWNVTDRIRAAEILPKVHASLEQKYALRLYRLREQAFPTPEPAQEQRSGFGRFGAMLANVNLSDDGDEGPEPDPEPELTEAELEAQAEAERLARVQRAYDSFSQVRPVEIEIGDITRTVRRRIFLTDEVERIGRALHGEDEVALQNYRDSFIYLDWETGLVNAETTDMNHIPSWYDENEYDIVQIGSWEYVRELPGPKNALGKVKIIFPNYDNIYLHDTPAKSLFSNPVRAFSHGCIRVEDPLTLAQTLLELGGKGDFNPRQVLADEIYHPVFLDRQIPIYLEYYTVSVDDEGRANFLADPYRFDVEALADDT